MIRRDYVLTEVRGTTLHTHYRHSGEGAPIVLLHPSPLSSEFMCPVMELLHGLGAVYAPDTPGYGQSDVMPESDDDLVIYTEWLLQFLDQLELDSVVLYGSATGAQIAIEFSKAHPQRVKFLVLENAVHFEDREREEIMQRYFPELEAKPDGGHLQTAWRMSDRLFRSFPWYDESPQAAIDGPEPPVAMVHATAMAYLNAGPLYSRAYRAAFLNEKAERLRNVPVPTAVMRWQGSILKNYAQRFDDMQWPEHIKMIHSDCSVQERFAALRNTIESWLESDRR